MFHAASLFLLIALTSPAAPPPALPGAPHVLAFLNRAIQWRNSVDAQAALADQPTDVFYVNDDRNLARQVAALSFESAKAVAQVEASNGAAPAPAATVLPADDAARDLGGRAAPARAGAARRPAAAARECARGRSRAARRGRGRGAEPIGDLLQLNQKDNALERAGRAADALQRDTSAASPRR